MRAKIKNFISPDTIWESPESQARKFCILVQVIAGPDDGPGEESFDVSVCDIDYLADLLESEPVISGLHYLIVDKFDREVIEGFLKRQIESIQGPTWHAIAERISRIGYWEFENYKPYIPSAVNPE